MHTRSRIYGVVVIGIIGVVAQKDLRRGEESSPTSPTQTPYKHYNINYRQLVAPAPAPDPNVPPQAPVPAPAAPPAAPPNNDQPPTTTSSYDYWWPYPPAGASSSVFTADPLAPTGPDGIMTLPVSSDMANLTTSASVGSTPATAQSIITISVPSSSINSTSLPTLVTYPKTHLISTKLIMYLIPVFVVAGVILGSLCAWLGWGCYTRKPRLRNNRRHSESVLEVGPAYESTSADAEKVTRASSSTDAFGWTGLDSPFVNGGGVKHRDEEYPETGFLVPPAAFRTSRPSSSSKSRSTSVSRSPGRADRRYQDLSRSATSKTSNTTYTATSVSVYSQAGDEDDNDDDRRSFLDAYETDDLEAAQTGRPGPKRIVSRRRQIHSRGDSDLCISNVDLSRRPTSSTIQTTSTPGFRIVQESPLPTPNTRRAMLMNSPPPSSNGLFWSSRSSRDDMYTPLPSRGDRSRSTSPAKRQAPSGDYGPGARRALHHPLPQSPTQIRSPKLEGNLCFTPVLGGPRRG